MGLGTYLISALLVLAVNFVVFRVLVRKQYRDRRRLTPLITLLEYAAVFTWAWHTWLNRPTDWPAVQVGSVIEVVGWILFAGGMGMAFVGMVLLGLRRTHGLQVDTLKQSGLYGLSRNPQIVLFVLGIIGYAMLWPSWRNVGAVFLVAALSHMMVLTDEEHLREVFGEEYLRYCERVPRYVGVPQKQ